MHLIFDTSILIDIEKGNEKTLQEIKKLRDLYPAPSKIPFMAYYEFLYGIRKRNPKNKAKAEALLELFSVLQTTTRTAKNMSQLKDKYEFPLADLLIAAQVMEANAILVTKDKDFENINEIDKIIL